MNIVYAADDNYAIPMAVSILSCAANRAVGSETNFWVLSDGINKNALIRIRKQLAIVSRGTWLFQVVAISEETFRELTWRENGNVASRATLVRVAIADLLPQSLDRIVYLDSDIVVLDDVGKLGDIDIGGCQLAAVGDWLFPDFKTRWGNAVADGAKKYLNAGVLVIDLKAWRSRKSGDAIALAYQSTRLDMRYQDQDAINLVFDGQWYPLDWRYNFQSGMDSYADEETRRTMFERARQAGWDRGSVPAIIHYVGPKPWIRGFNDPDAKYWWDALRRTAAVPWATRVRLKCKRYALLARRIYCRWASGLAGN